MDQSLIQSNPGLQTSAQISWNNIAGSAFSFSFEALNRFRQLDLDLGTVVSARHLFHDFLTIPSNEQRVIYDALKQLRSFSILGKAVYVGFGLRSVLVDLAQTEDGLACVALCAALTTNYDSFYAAQVLRELWRSRNDLPDAYCPMIHQWQGLVDLTAKSLNRTGFPQLVEGFTRIIPTSAILEHGRKPLVATDAKNMAVAIAALARTGLGAASHCSISGGVDCAWLAAFGEFVLGLSVEIVTAEGALFYRSRSGSGDKAQATFIFNDGREGALVRGTDVILPLGHSLIDFKTRSTPNPIFSRQSSWDSIFHDSFGDSFQVLASQRDDGGRSKLCMVLQAASTGEFIFNRLRGNVSGASSNPDFEGLRKHPRASGVSFLRWVSGRFPEIAQLHQGRPLEPLAVDPYQLHLCPFSCCSELPAHYLTSTRTGACLSIISTAVSIFCLYLSAVNAEDTMLPSPTALQFLYDNVATFARSSHSACFGADLEAVISLFTGAQDPNWPNGKHFNQSALAKSGICAYRAVLGDPHLEPCLWSSVNVAFGMICKDGTQYHSICDLATSRVDGGIYGRIFDAGDLGSPPRLRLDAERAFLVHETPKRHELSIAIIAHVEKVHILKRSALPHVVEEQNITEQVLLPSKVAYNISQGLMDVKHPSHACEQGFKHWLQGDRNWCVFDHKRKARCPLTLPKPASGWLRICLDERVRGTTEVGTRLRELTTTAERSLLPESIPATEYFDLTIEECSHLELLCLVSNEGLLFQNTKGFGISIVFTQIACLDCILASIAARVMDQRALWIEITIPGQTDQITPEDTKMTIICGPRRPRLENEERF